jgi:ATP-binding cassette subfamily B protein
MTLLIQLVNQRASSFALSFFLGQVQQASSGSKDFFEVLATKRAITDRAQATELRSPPLARGKQSTGEKGKFIEFRNVSFSYDSDKKVIDDVSFSIAAHAKLALVGESGQGKTTIVNLLLRFYEPQNGVIRIANQDIASVTQKLHKIYRRRI